MNKHIKIEKNIKGRDFVIGDLHGNYPAFEKALENISFNFNEDRMFSVGDLIDRGDFSEKCLRLTELPWFHSVRGNHEQMMIESELNLDTARMWMRHGGDWIADISDETLNELRGLCRKLPISIVIDNEIGITHAECPFNGSEYDWNCIDDRANEERLIWGRKQIKTSNSQCQNIIKTYHGHTTSENIIRQGNSYFLDTGACWPEKGGFLTCLEINNEK